MRAVAAPENWKTQTVKMVLVTVFGMLFGVASLVMAYADGVRKHHLAEAVAMGGWGVLALTGAVLAVLIPGGFASSRVNVEDDAVLVRPALVLDLVLRALLIVMAVAGIVGIGAWWHGEAYVSDSLIDHRQEMRFLYASVAMAFMGVWTCPRWFSPRGLLGFLRLDAQGLEYRLGRRTVEIAWDDVTAISDTAARGRDLSCPITFTQTDGQVITYAPTSFGRDAAVIYRAIRFYWQHPERRTEFGTDAAAERIWHGDLGPLALMR